LRLSKEAETFSQVVHSTMEVSMKQKTFSILALLATALAMIVGNAAASDSTRDSSNVQALINGQIQTVMTATDTTGGTPPITMVSGQTSLQSQPNTDILGTQGLTANVTRQTQIQLAINAAGNTQSSVLTANTAQDASPVDPSGSGAQLVTGKNFAEAVNPNGGGGNSFHAGKNFIASTPIEAAACLMTTSIAT